MHEDKTVSKSQRLWDQKYYQSHHTNSLYSHLPDYFVHLNIAAAPLAFPTGFPHLLKIPLIYLRYLSFSLPFNLYCSKASSLPINEVLLLLKYKSQRLSHKCRSQSFSYQTHQNCSPSIHPQTSLRDSHSLYLLPPSHFTKLYIKKKGINLA